jgi:transcriptional regulator with XRE-family HTH domain
VRLPGPVNDAGKRLLSLIEFHNFLRDRRVKLRLRLEDVAEAAGLNRAAVSRWESGSRTPSLTSLMRIAPVLKMRVVVDVDGTVHAYEEDARCQ